MCLYSEGQPWNQWRGFLVGLRWIDGFGEIGDGFVAGRERERKSLHRSEDVEAKRESDDVALFGDDIVHRSEDVLERERYGNCNPNYQPH
uniref:Uncharacterized protein n=1 Tax=Fagus sylvatica TaxID=28930 RepID=A0A2N9HI83_FAGSY